MSESPVIETTPEMRFDAMAALGAFKQTKLDEMLAAKVGPDWLEKIDAVAPRIAMVRDEETEIETISFDGVEVLRFQKMVVQFDKEAGKLVATQECAELWKEGTP